jgi:hypothetical protein
MSEKNTLFEQASRLKLRFGSPQGPLTVDDLWDLPLTSRTNRANLDDIARFYSRELKEQETESFVTKPARKDKILMLGFEIVKRVIEVRLEENKAIKDKAEKAAKKAKLLELLSKKKDDQLGEMTEEQLLAEIEKLG